VELRNITAALQQLQVQAAALASNATVLQRALASAQQVSSSIEAVSPSESPQSIPALSQQEFSEISNFRTAAQTSQARAEAATGLLAIFGNQVRMIRTNRLLCLHFLCLTARRFRVC
jgi:hypothetical protein